MSIREGLYPGSEFVSKRIVVKNGVNVHTMEYVRNKTDYFGGPQKQGFTENLVSGRQELWEVVLLNRKTGEQNRFRFGTSMSVGRSSSNESTAAGMVISNDMMVSKNHCTIIGTRNGLYVQDNNSKNHTFVNGNMVKEPMKLEQGDVIKIGATELCVSYGKVL